MRRPSDGRALPGAPSTAVYRAPKGRWCRAWGVLLGKRTWEWARVITSPSSVDLAQERFGFSGLQRNPLERRSLFPSSSAGGRYGQRSPRQDTCLVEIAVAHGE